MEPGDFAFDAVLAKLLGLLGVNSVIILLVGAAFAIHSYFGPVRKAIEFGRVVRQRATGMTAYRAVMIVLVFASQALVVYMCYAIGNFFSMLGADAARKADVDQLFAASGAQALMPWSAETALRFDWLSGTYVVCAIVAVYLSYRGAWGFGLVLTLPVIGFGLLALVGFLLTLLTGDVDTNDEYYLKVSGTAVAIAVLFCIACVTSLRGSSLVARRWDGTLV